MVVVAEIGTNYASEDPAERLSLAKLYVNQTVGICRADYAKFQMFMPCEPLFCALGGDDKRWERWQQCAMTKDQWYQLKDHCDERGYKFFASAFQHSAVEFLETLECDYIKVASRAVEKFPYRKGPYVISDGMFKPPPEECIRPGNILLQCNSKYPSPLEESSWERNDGLSDHSGTPWPAIDALAKGARMVEVHFGKSSGPDAIAAVNARELSQICQARDAFTKMRSGKRSQIQERVAG